MPSEVIEEKPGSLGLPGFDELDEIRDSSNTGGPWIVILYNCDCHSYADVIEILQKAIGCTVEEGYALAHQVHTRGRAIVFSGEKEECERVAAIIGSIRLQVETDHA